MNQYKITVEIAVYRSIVRISTTVKNN